MTSAFGKQIVNFCVDFKNVVFGIKPFAYAALIGYENHFIARTIKCGYQFIGAAYQLDFFGFKILSFSVFYNGSVAVEE